MTSITIEGMQMDFSYVRRTFPALTVCMWTISMVRTFLIQTLCTYIYIKRERVKKFGCVIKSFSALTLSRLSLFLYA